MFKLFVGTMESGEAEFEACRESIIKQKNVEVEHFIIRNLGEKAAHRKLIQGWLEKKGEFDYFVKVDADTILNSNKSLFLLANLMKEKSASGLQVKLFDYFTNDLLSGLNMFDGTVKFKRFTPRLRPDRVDFGHRLILKGSSVQHLEPIGFHAKYPNPKQSFYFGFHRYLKNQQQILQKCFTEWQKHLDEARRWAITGAIVASQQPFNRFYFSSDKVKKYFEDQKYLSNIEIIDLTRDRLKLNV